jgi:hypothetical protein
MLYMGMTVGNTYMAGKQDAAGDVSGRTFGSL